MSSSSLAFSDFRFGRTSDDSFSACRTISDSSRSVAACCGAVCEKCHNIVMTS